MEIGYARTDETFLRSVLNTVCEGEVFSSTQTHYLEILESQEVLDLDVFLPPRPKLFSTFLAKQELGLEFKWLVVVENWLSLLLSALPRGS